MSPENPHVDIALSAQCVSVPLSVVPDLATGLEGPGICQNFLALRPRVPHGWLLWALACTPLSPGHLLFPVRPRGYCPAVKGAGFRLRPVGEPVASLRVCVVPMVSRTPRRQSSYLHAR